MNSETQEPQPMEQERVNLDRSLSEFEDEEQIGREYDASLNSISDVRSLMEGNFVRGGHISVTSSGRTSVYEEEHGESDAQDRLNSI